MSFERVNMKKYFLVLLVGIPFSSLANPLLQPFLKQRGISAAKTAIYAVWAETGEPIVAYQEELPLIPASSLKVLTAYCLLKKLGPNHTLETKVYSEGPIQNGQTQNLMIQGEGDPSLVIERLWLLAQGLKTLGLKKINGNIYLDASYFDDKDYPGQQENNHRAYNARPSALALNFNAISIHSGEATHYRNVPDPIGYFGQNLAELLSAHHIAFQGKVLEGKTAAAHLLATFSSKPLSQMVWDMNKFSNNFIAEQLVKYLGAKTFGPPGTTAKGVQILKQCLKEIDPESFDLTLVNGSGFSYDNQVTAKALVKVLTAGYHDFSLRPELISSLSIAGLDGTMKSRKSPNELIGILRAKTGSLNGTSSLAGFIPNQEGELIAFGFLLNQFKGGLWEAQKWQDALLVRLRQIKRKR